VGRWRERDGGCAVNPTLSDARFPYFWAWSQPTTEVYGPRTSGWFDRDRKGERCCDLTEGSRAMNSALVEFEDGYRVVTSRNGLRRAR
jgi:hypothetical protein